MAGAFGVVAVAVGVDDGHGAAVVVHRRGSRRRVVGWPLSSAEDHRLGAALQSAAEAGDDAACEAVLDELADVLWARAVSDLLDGSTTTLSEVLSPGTGGVLTLLGAPLTRLPLAAVPLPDGRPMVEAATVAAAASLASPAPGPAVARALVYASRDSAAGSLAAAAEEAMHVAGCLEGRGASVKRVGACLGGPVLTPEGAGAMLAGHDLVHLALHARASAHDADRAWLELDASSDGARRLSLGGLRDLDLSGATVVLSGCETYRSASAGAVAVPSLAEGALLAGAQGVLATRWPVPDAVTAAFVARVYTELDLAAPDWGVALARAQRAARREGVAARVWAAWVWVLGERIRATP